MDNIDKRYLIAGSFILLVLVFLAGFKYAEYRNPDSSEQLELIEVNPAEKPERLEDSLIQVYICGEVKKPGVYQLKENDRVYQAVEMAGPEDKADLRLIDMARPLVDGETIVIPGEGEPAVEVAGIQGASQLPVSSPASPASSAKVNINKATAIELADKLNGIGPALSQRIVDYREANGAFQKIEDIKNVSGIGEKKFEAIKDHITVR
ncbi:MAG: helix-hairpin-helix domain-containing protein [Syntrophomonas sp.]|uniref:helix-hairpin-helix domain-containing protein n=1 Tax=Syntrophomonas sp. TaxID=2053627 RepID=UPI002612FC34|nr:helix-hairpin-helix domain-containing protein [Syntrophomonas sp.]MDD2511033.1 helix-hairpin-helix domain-containing protein [Syntrophomonas sp.]MDD3879556.1 helix-hairpin-helix domain-containing protein [Syntrophomonas sp.]MDD4625928.1 helix-hairpin-helix domain-containing protein [Syntrophomonas sp.]